eukprot:SAG31_NODE_12411_length_944_cov_0.852071_1_plen_300_part_10
MLPLALVHNVRNVTIEGNVLGPGVGTPPVQINTAVPAGREIRVVDNTVINGPTNDRIESSSSSPVGAAEPNCVFVLPSRTSTSVAQISDTPPNGNGASKAKHIDPGHYVCEPVSGVPPRGLLLFVPGLAAVDYTLFARTAAGVGYATAVISTQQCAGLCSTTIPNATINATEECGYASRLMRLVGKSKKRAPPVPRHCNCTAVPQGNSIEGRLIALLSYLGASASNSSTGFRRFETFLTDSGEVRWGQVSVAGHSCASYYPLLLATLYRVRRLIMIGGVGQPLVGYGPLQLPASDVCESL